MADSDREIPSNIGVTGTDESRIEPIASLYMGDEGGDGVSAMLGEEESAERSRGGRRNLWRCLGRGSCVSADASSSASVAMKHIIPGCGGLGGPTSWSGRRCDDASPARGRMLRGVALLRD